MGYSTIFKGSLQFTRELKASELATLGDIFGEDCRDHPEWLADDLYYVDLQLTEDFSGIEWDDKTEKTSDMAGLVNLILRLMKGVIPDFGLEGIMYAQGDEAEDRYEIHIQDGLAVKVKTPPAGTKIKCPDCEHIFYLGK